jgi:hypothetical protein
MMALTYTMRVCLFVGASLRQQKRRFLMHTQPRSLIATGLFLILLCALPVLAQFDTATVLGTVKDPAGAVMANATVTLKNNATGITVTTTTDSDGNYQFPNVRIGEYRVSATAQGFSTAVAERINIVVNARQRVDLTLQPGAVTETVVITDAAQLLETESSVRGQSSIGSKSSTCRSTGVLMQTWPCWRRACANRT